VQVLVRDNNGHPIAGLGSDDFSLTEDGTRDRVLEVRSLAHISQSNSAISAPGQQPLRHSQAWPTFVLLVLAPMSAPGRDSAVKSLLKFLDSPMPAGWQVGLIDDAGKFTPFTHDSAILRTRLLYLSNHLSPAQHVGGSWPAEAGRAIQELAIQIGRHAIVFATDFDSNVSNYEARDHRQVRFGPSDFISDAVRAQAAVYTVEATGPRVLVPFGGAAESQSQYTGSGQEVAEAMRLELVGAFETRGNFLLAARETGGLAAADMQEALADVAADADGYYQITFTPNLQQTDGAWHPISVSVPGRNVRLRGPRYYLAPISDDQQRIQATMLAALENRTAPRFESAARVWLFPDSGDVYTALMAADFIWPAMAGTPASSRKLQIFAQLVNESLQQMVGAWLNEQPWKLDGQRSASVHWQRETPLYPGRYSLRVIALDSVTGTVGTREYEFAVYPSAISNFHLSDIVVADRCLAEDEVQGRSNLLDPLSMNGCLLSPSAAASFSAARSPTLMIRLYATNPRLRELIQKQWKAFIVLGDGPRIPVSIAAGNVRGMVVTEPLDLQKLKLKQGANPIEVIFEAKSDDGQKHTIAIRSQLTVTP